MCGDNGKENGNYYSILGLYVRIMEKKLETTIVYWGYIGIMEKKMDTIVYWGIGDDGTENGDYCTIMKA